MACLAGDGIPAFRFALIRLAGFAGVGEAALVPRDLRGLFGQFSPLPFPLSSVIVWIALAWLAMMRIEPLTPTRHHLFDFRWSVRLLTRWQSLRFPRLVWPLVSQPFRRIFLWSIRIHSFPFLFNSRARKASIRADSEPGNFRAASQISRFTVMERPTRLSFSGISGLPRLFFIFILIPC